MADSFFGFNTSLDEIEDGGGVFDPSEDEYDALNDETFGEMVDDGDWEQQHEEFSMLSENAKHMDIEGTLSNLIIDNDETAKKTIASSSIHGTAAQTQQSQQMLSALNSLPALPPLPSLTSLKNVCTVEELERSLRQQQQPMPPLQLPQQQPPILPMFQPPRFMNNMMPPSLPLMGNQSFVGHPPNQAMPYHVPQPHPNVAQQFGNFNMIPPNMPSGNIPPRLPLIPNMEQQNMFHPMHFNQQQNNFNNPNNISHQRFSMNPQQMALNKPPFPPNQQPFVHNQQFPPNQHFPQNNQPPFPINQQPVPINQPQLPSNQPHTGNVQQQSQNHQLSPVNARISQNHQNNNRNQQTNNANQNAHSQNLINKSGNTTVNSNNNKQSMNSNNNNFNNTKSQNDTNSLIQMIQNTHPMLQNNLHPGYMNAFIANPLLGRGIFPRHFGNMPPGLNNLHSIQKSNENQRRQVPVDIDPYKGLMTTREKQWLLNIQMMQLNTGTPYIDDYYYTVFLERKVKKQKEEVKEAHKMNQENHPFSQKNLANNKFKGENENRRERCNSTRSNTESNTPHTPYVPTQFENSLGKLQCGSVTAPRKIIDMEIIGHESPTGEIRSNSYGSSTAGVIGAPRGTRHILLAIETLYRILLRLEDLSEPLAIANAVILKEREEKQKALLLEQQQNESQEKLEDDNNTSEEPTNSFLRDIEQAQKPKSNVTLNSNISTSSVLQPQPVVVPNLLDENKPDLLGKLFAGLLFEDRLLSFMTIRKGKMLVMRILAQAVPTERWRAPLGRVWPRLLRALPYALRRDTNVLNPLVDHFQQYLYGTEGWAPVSDLCLMLSEESGPVSQRSSSVPIRSVTPSLPSRSLMYYIMSTTFGLSLLVALMERAAVLPKPAPAAWNNMVRCASRLVNVSGSARPFNILSRPLLTAHAAAAELSPTIEESMAEILSQS